MNIIAVRSLNSNLSANTNSNLSKPKSNVNFGMKMVPEIQFLERILNMRKVPSLPNANGGNVINETMRKIVGNISIANKNDLLDFCLETKAKMLGLDVNDVIPNYKNLEAQLRFKVRDGKLVMTLSSEPISVNGLPFGLNGKKIAECYAPQNFGQAGTTATVEISGLSEHWARELPNKTEKVGSALIQLMSKFSDVTFANVLKRMNK